MAGHAPPPLPTVEAFKKATTVKYGLKKSARNSISFIDVALAEWHKTTTQPWDFKRRRLLDLVRECRTWLTKRRDKKVSKALGVRIPQVRQLGMNALEWLKYVQFELAKDNKKVFFPKVGHRIAPSTGLKPGYASERLHYVAKHKAEMPYSGTFAHQWTGIQKQQVQNRQLDPTTLPLAMQAILLKPFDQFTEVDFQTMETFERRGPQARVWYMSKDERRAFMLIIQDGIFYKGLEEPLTITGAAIYMYAIDQYGSTFAARPNASDSLARGDYLNHSTFNAGKDVICAGTITMQFGKLTLDNASGHYQPTRQQLHEAICMYDEAGLDLSRWNVGIYTPNSGTDVFNANAFRANVNIPLLQSIGKAT